MRALVISALLVTALALPAGAQVPSAITGCTGPGNCATVNTGPCGTLLNVARDGTITPMAGNDPRLGPNIRGVCGFIAPPGYALNTANPAACVSDADCSYTVDQCGRKTAVNTAYQSMSQAQLTGETRNCGSIDTRQVIEEHCAANACVVTLGGSR